MGPVVAQDIFQSKLDSIFIGMEGVTGIADDMVIAGRDEMEHDRNFLAFMKKYEQQPDSQLRKDPDPSHICLSKLCTKREQTFQLQMHSVV